MQTPSIKTKFLLVTIGMILLLGLTMIVLAKTVLQTKLHAKLEKRGVSLARSVARDSMTPLLTGQYFELELMAKDLKSAEEDIEYVFIVNPQGEVAAHTFEQGFPIDLKKLHNSGIQPFFIQHFESEKGWIKDIAVPLVGGRAGTVHLGMSEAVIKKDIDDIVMAVVWTIVVLVAVGSITAAYLATRVTSPLHLLAVAVQAVERGDLRARVPVRSDDEIGQLGAALNNMAGARMQAEHTLVKSEKKLRDITASLAEGILVVNETGHLVFMNPEAERLLGWTESELSGRVVHEVVHAHKADETQLLLDECPNMRVIKTGTRCVVDDDVFFRKDGIMLPVAYISAPIFEGGTVAASIIAFRDITVHKQSEVEREKLIAKLREALDNVKTLKGMMPICASCKKIRDDKGYWTQIEAYIADHSDAEFSHGICPECAKRLYPEYFKDES